ncbi:MAG: hypothetical protein Q6365_023525 [Candidatus Sigynarchaeota archaeon]
MKRVLTPFGFMMIVRSIWPNAASRDKSSMLVALEFGGCHA